MLVRYYGERGILVEIKISQIANKSNLTPILFDPHLVRLFGEARWSYTFPRGNGKVGSRAGGVSVFCFRCATIDGGRDLGAH